MEKLKYRRAVPEKGGSQDEMKTMTDYLGREVSMTGLYKDLSLF